MSATAEEIQAAIDKAAAEMELLAQAVAVAIAERKNELEKK